MSNILTTLFAVVAASTAGAEGLKLVEPVGLVSAVATAEETTGGRAIEAEYDDDAGGVYKVDVFSGKSIRRVIVDARSGAVVAEKKRRVESLWRKWSSSDALESARAGQPLGELLRSVESATTGRVTDVELITSGGRVFYNVDTVSRDGERTLIVDPVSGTALVAVDD